MLGICKYHIVLHFSSNHPRNLATVGRNGPLLGLFRSHTGTEAVPYWESRIVGLRLDNKERHTLLDMSFGTESGTRTHTAIMAKGF